MIICEILRFIFICFDLRFRQFTNIATSDNFLRLRFLCQFSTKTHNFTKHALKTKNRQTLTRNVFKKDKRRKIKKKETK